MFVLTEQLGKAEGMTMAQGLLRETDEELWWCLRRNFLEKNHKKG